MYQIGAPLSVQQEKILFLDDTQGVSLFRLPSQLEVILPSFFREDPENETLALRIQTLGFRTAIFSTKNTTLCTHRLSWKGFENGLKVLRKCGIQVALDFRQAVGVDQKISDLSHFFDFVFCRQDELYAKGVLAPLRDDFIEYERAKEELLFLEERYKKPIIYFIDTKNHAHAMRQAHFLKRLAFEVLPTTMIGCFGYCSETYVPFFEKFEGKIVPFIKVRPFPECLFGLYEKIAATHGSSAVGYIVDSFHEEGALSELPLYAVGQNTPSHVAIGKWLKKWRPEWQCERVLRCFSKIEELLLEQARLDEVRPERLKKKQELLLLGLEDLLVEVDTHMPDAKNSLFTPFALHFRQAVEGYKRKR